MINVPLLGLHRYGITTFAFNIPPICHRHFHHSTQPCSASHYDTLGIARNSTTRQIKKRFYELSKKYHPDKTRTLQHHEKTESNHKFQKIKEAYDTLSSTALRASYDSSLIASAPSGNPYYNQTGERPSGQTHLRRRKVYNFGRPFTNPHMSTGNPGSSGDPDSSSSSTAHDASGNNPLNPGYHRTGSNYDVPHFDFDKHFKQQQGYEEHRMKRVQEKAQAAHSHQKQFEYYENKKSNQISLSTIGTISAVLLAAFAYFH